MTDIRRLKARYNDKLRKLDRQRKQQEDKTFLDALADTGVVAREVMHTKAAEEGKGHKEMELIRAEMARRALARRHLLPFVMRNEPNYLAGWFHKDLCRRLEKFSQDVIDGKSPRLMITVPPRHGKSRLASINFPAWHLGRQPNHEIIAASYAGSLSMSFSRKVREIIRSKSYQAVFPDTKLSPDSQSVEAWQTTKGGGYVAAGVGSGITGKGAHIAIIDDPVKDREEAESEVRRQAVKDWYTSTLYTRLAPGGGVLLIQTRWHDDDLAGWLESEMENGGDRWEIVRYPAIAVEDEKFRAKGEPLHPERYDLEALARIKRAVGPRDWQALYQQNPVAEDGDYFRKEDFQFYEEDELPPLDEMYTYAAWDLAIGRKEGNDYTAGVVVAVDRDDNIWVLELIHGRFETYQLVDHILNTHKKWDCQITGIEQGHIKMTMDPIIQKRMQETGNYIGIQELKPGRNDKQARARPIQARMQQGKVLFPKRADFTQEMMAEMMRFPNGKHDDIVDAMAWIGQMMVEFAKRPQKQPPKKKSWKDVLQSISSTNDGGSWMSA